MSLRVRPRDGNAKMNPHTFDNMRKFLPFLESQNLCVVSKDWNVMVQNSASKINCAVWMGDFAEMPLEKAKKICPLITNLCFDARHWRPTLSKQAEIFPHFTNLKHLNFYRNPNDENWESFMGIYDEDDPESNRLPHTSTFCSETCSIMFENSQNTLETLKIDGHCFDQYLPLLFFGKVFFKLQKFHWEIYPDTDLPYGRYGEVCELNMMQNFFNQFSKMFPNLNPLPNRNQSGFQLLISNMICGFSEVEAFGKWMRDTHGLSYLSYKGCC